MRVYGKFLSIFKHYDREILIGEYFVGMKKLFWLLFVVRWFWSSIIMVIYFLILIHSILMTHENLLNTIITHEEAYCGLFRMCWNILRFFCHHRLWSGQTGQCPLFLVPKDTFFKSSGPKYGTLQASDFLTLKKPPTQTSISTFSRPFRCALADKN